MTYLLNERINITENFLKRKLYYAYTLAPQYADGLLCKLKLIKRHKIMIFTYLPIYFIIFLIHKTFAKDYDTTTLEVFDYHLVDIYFCAYFLCSFRPQPLPEGFNFDFGNDMSEDFGLIYKIMFPAISDFEKKYEKIKPTHKDISYIKGRNIPVIVVGPGILRGAREDNKSDSSSTEELDKDVNEGKGITEKTWGDYGINRYIDSLSLGFTSVN